jgi:membrane-bound serine protease (ClpP class)
MFRRALLIGAMLVGGIGVTANNASVDDTTLTMDPAAVAVDTVESVVPLTVYQVNVEGMIDGGLAEFMLRAVDIAEQESAAALLLEMNTYGGRVDAADVIRSALLETTIPTITFIHPNAASAGALISISTDSIAMSPGSAIGAATPVNQQGVPASSKVISYFRTLMGETARATGRDPRIAEAMVDSTIVVSEIEDAPRPLTLRPDQAIAVGIAQHEARSIEDVLRLNGLAGARVIVIRENWAEKVVRFLTNPMVSGLLLTIGALGLISELTSPGFGVAGTAGALSLVLFFGSHYIVNLADFTELLIFIVGAGMVVAEMFVPGGILGVIGTGLMLTGLFLSLIGKFEFVTPPDLSGAFTSVGIAIILTFVGIVILLRGFAEMPFVRRLTLYKQQTADRGDDLMDVSRNTIVGALGIAETDLRPGGRIRVEDAFIDATTEGDHIEAGAHIQVVGYDGISGAVVRRA